MTNKEILVKAFKALDITDLRRLKKHLENKTPIFCGDGSSMFYYNRKGYA